MTATQCLLSIFPEFVVNLADLTGENYQYVQLQPIHDYIYPAEEQQKPKCSIEMIPLHQQQPPLPLKGANKGPQFGTGAQQPNKKSPKIRVRCRHCNELYTEDKNNKGACEYAPDLIKSTIDTISCIGCAQCICYHCASDAEGDFAQHPCDCTNDENCSTRWFCLTLLSILVPCLWLYPPLKICHWCGIQCGVCGGRHAM